MDTVEKPIDIDAPILPHAKTLFAKLNAVRASVHYIRKDKRVGEGGYLAVTHDAVTALVREHLIREGVLIIPSLVSSQVVLTGTTTAKGVPFIRYEARYRFTILNVENANEQIVFDLEAHAFDQGDKAPGKALSYAKKYAVLKLFEIESGEGEEDREVQRPAHAPSPSSGARGRVSPDRLEACDDLGSEVLDLLNADMFDKAATKFYEAALEADERVYVWTFFESKQKTAMVKAWDIIKKARAEAQSRVKP